LHSPAESRRNSRYSVGFGELEGSFEVFRRRKIKIFGWVWRVRVFRILSPEWET
jgi:hypothetical protein